ncbi:MAG: DUF5068 domain-containing protein [Bacillota bacterium]|uniref:DUF5068 domain-containing protein n=1 Tax=Virgibacillus salarius TaxID=447199 RepID=A0A941IB06_9BACI|nr:MULTISPECIES: DUF5068 domain-containing protein [Bacillaceae]NAZ09932.1 DUF5068 domain-containing protein [Agaribacter marinus]MBR7797223.1 DUF5068 domain-containing protein [Virgibacillus salarius]MCC2250162.1 DUF5068 domain-containing protein [Virgibacillus sp. AGTR]MDY7045723.1 DUF5068 domain-containing protein [Virgibacillus sp. M23]QRZ19044.1 DUF5068 domain-containing protein [Virgibacillus sp. AGTR]
MSKKIIMLLITIVITALIVSGCGSDKNEAKDSEANDAKESATTKEDSKNEAKAEEETKETVQQESDGSNDFSKLISYMEEQTEGTTEVVYENNEPQTHEMEGVTVSLDGYSLVELKDFHTDYAIPFNDQTNGGVIVAKYTVKNDTDNDAYYMPSFYLSYTGAQKSFNNYRDLLPEEEQLPTKLAPSNDYVIKSGETITGYYTYPFGEDQWKQVLAESTATAEVPAPQAKKDDFSSTFGKKGTFTFSLNKEGAEKVEDNKAFYQDKATAGNMGDKKMLSQKDGIGESEKLGDITVTLDGYQFTEFKPNKEEAPRFEAFSNGIVLLTVKFNIDNKSDSEVAHSSIMSKLTVNDGSQYMLNEGMLLNYKYDDMIESGSAGELLQIYTLDQEQYEKIWKDKSFEVEIGPMKDQEANDISKGKKATFTLPK